MIHIFSKFVLLYLFLILCLLNGKSWSTSVIQSGVIKDDTPIYYLPEDVLKQLQKELDDIVFISGGGTLDNFTKYYDQLTATEKEIYNIIYQGSIKSPPDLEFLYIFDDTTDHLPIEDVHEKISSMMRNIYTILGFEHPELWWIERYGYSLSYYLNTFVYNVTISTKPSYSLFNSYTADDIVKITRKMEIMKNDIMKRISDLNLSTDYGKLKFIHDYIVLKSKYLKDEDRKHIRTVYGTLVENLCVCAGYAKAFQYMAHQYNIDCIAAISLTHEWNYVKLNNIWYAVDVTWDDPNYSNLETPSGFGYDKYDFLSHKYFFIGSTNLTNYDSESSHTVTYSMYLKSDNTTYDSISYPPISSSDYIPTNQEIEDENKISVAFSSSYIDTKIGKFIIIIIIII